eukprot:3916409-Rhodomonas_salina.2
MQPSGGIPVAKIDGRVITESNDIMQVSPALATCATLRAGGCARARESEATEASICFREGGVEGCGWRLSGLSSLTSPVSFSPLLPPSTPPLPPSFPVLPLPFTSLHLLWPLLPLRVSGVALRVSGVALRARPLACAAACRSWSQASRSTTPSSLIPPTPRSHCPPFLLFLFSPSSHHPSVLPGRECGRAGMREVVVGVSLAVPRRLGHASQPAAAPFALPRDCRRRELLSRWPVPGGA